jgi:hypothetical protein
VISGETSGSVHNKVDDTICCSIFLFHADFHLNPPRSNGDISFDSAVSIRIAIPEI